MSQENLQSAFQLFEMGVKSGLKSQNTKGDKMLKGIIKVMIDNECLDEDANFRLLQTIEFLGEMKVLGSLKK